MFGLNNFVIILSGYCSHENADFVEIEEMEIDLIISGIVMIIVDPLYTEVYIWSPNQWIILHVPSETRNCTGLVSKNTCRTMQSLRRS